MNADCPLRKVRLAEMYKTPCPCPKVHANAKTLGGFAFASRFTSIQPCKSVWDLQLFAWVYGRFFHGSQRVKTYKPPPVCFC